MRIPSRQMLILRSIVTLQLSAVIGQAGWAAAGLGRASAMHAPGKSPVIVLDEAYMHLHEIFAGVTLLVTVVSAALYVAFRRHAGPVNLWLALGSLVVTLAQYALGESGIRDVHVFLGVLLAMLVTALTSWTYRHDDGGPPAFVARGARVE